MRLIHLIPCVLLAFASTLAHPRSQDMRLAAAHCFGPQVTEPQDDDPVTVVKVYHIHDFLRPTQSTRALGQDWPGTGLLGQEANAQPSAPGFMGGIGGGMGGGMGLGGMGGGGMFNARPEQMMGSPGQGMGMGDSGGPSTILVPVPQTSGDHGQELIDLIEAMVEDDEMIHYGQLHIYDGLLVARQTVAIHQKIDAVLSAVREGLAQEIMVQLQWAAVRVDSQVARQMASGLEQDQLEQIIDQHAVAVGSLATRNGQRVFSTSGEHRNLVIGVTPVVGAFQDFTDSRRSATGYSPKTAIPILGWVAEMRPIVPADPNLPGLIDVGISQVLKPATETPLGLGTIDRGNLPAFQAVGSVAVVQDQWALLGGIAAGAQQDADADSPTMLVLVKWTRQ